MAKQNRFSNMYLTTTISVALVLFLIGIESVVMLSSHQMIRRLKENIALTILLSDEASASDIQSLGQRIEEAPYCHELHYVSKAEALQEHIEALGEDPEKFLGYNPLSNSYELQLKAEYALEDSILPIEQKLAALPIVDQVSHPKEIVSALDLHVGKMSLMLVAIALVLLLISVVLIINTVRLHVYSKRFIINTMRLVGATSWVIRAPFIHRNLQLGLEAGLTALVAVAGSVYLVHERLGVWLFDINTTNVLIISAVVMVGGEFITFVASMIATGKYIRMKTDKLYEI